MGSKAIIASSFGIAIVSLMLVQSMGPVIINYESHVDFNVTVQNAVYSIGEQVPFILNVTKGSILKYVFYFHDGTNATWDGSTRTVNHTFATEGHYLVGVYGFTTTNYNYPIDIFKAVEVTVRNSPPALTITTNTKTAFESSAVTFSSTFHDAGVQHPNANYQWVFGDGSNGTGTTVLHAYTNAGIYNVIAYATDSLGQIAMANTTVTVTGQVPDIKVTTNATSILEGQAVKFDASQTKASNAEQSSLTYGWDFGNGNLGAGKVVTETYEHPGTYTATLTVQDQLGARVEKTITIGVANINPTITNMTMSKQVIPEGQTLYGFSQASDAQVDVPRLNYNWQFNNDTSTGRIASFTPFQPENTSAALTVTDTSGVTTSASRPVSVLNEPPQASIVGAEMNFNLTVIITGDKWKAITIQLLNEQNTTAINDTLVRQATNPWTMALKFYNINLDLTHVWRFVTEYTPNSTATNGADPVSLYLNLTNDNNVYYQIYNFTFNVQQPNWYTWVLPLDPFTNGLPIAWIINYFDPGLSALTITLDDNSSLAAFIPAKKTGSQSGTIVLFASISANETNPIKLSISDQYGLATSTDYRVDAPLNATMGYRLSLLAPLINSISSSALATNGTANYIGYEQTGYTFTVNATPFHNDLSTLQYIWTFGDGQVITTTTPYSTHSFMFAGLYEVSVQVVSPGTNLSTTQSILVNIQTQKPVIHTDNSDEFWKNVGDSIVLDISNTTAVASEQPLLYYWTNNDTATIHYTGHSAVLEHEFYYPGTDILTVFVVGAEGIITNKTFLIHVSDPGPSISTLQPVTGIEGNAILINPQVRASVIQVPFLTYTWHIGTMTFHQKLINKYFTYGNYTGSLTVEDSEGMSATSPITIQIDDQVPQMAPLPQWDYGIKSSNYRVVFTTKISNLDLGNYSYRVSGRWMPLTTNVINTTFDLAHYRDGESFGTIEIKDHAGIQYPQSVNITTIGDSNGDNIRDVNESILGSTLHADYDNDGITDFTEIMGWNISVLYAGRTTPTILHVHSDPTKAMTDGCLPDSQVYRLGGNPYAINQSTAQDGITDCQKAAVGLPLNVAINPSTEMTGSMNIVPSATSDQNTYSVTVQVLDSITHNPIVPYRVSNSALQYTTQNRVNFYNKTQFLGLCYLDNSSSCSFSYSSYQDNISADFFANGLYDGSSMIIKPSYNTSDLLHNLGPGSNPITNAMGYILKHYVENSGAFTPDGNSYTMNSDDANQSWNYNGYHVGYFIPGTIYEVGPSSYSAVPNYPRFSKTELDTYSYSNDLITVFYYNGTTSGVTQVLQIAKSQLIYDLLGLKLMTWHAEANPPTLTNAYNEFHQAAQNLTDLTGLAQTTYSASISSGNVTPPPPPPPHYCHTPQIVNGYSTNSLSCQRVVQGSTDAYMIVPDSTPNSGGNNGGTVTAVNATMLASSVQNALNLTTHTGRIHVVYPQHNSCSGIFSWAVCVIKDIINAVVSIAEDIITLGLSAINFVVHAWNAVVSPFLGTVEHVERDVTKVEVNFVIDTLWNFVIQPLLPTTAVFSLPSSLQTFLYTITDPTLPTKWEDAMNTAISPFTSVIPNVNIDIPGGQSALSSLGSGIGLFELINQIGGMQYVSWALNAIVNRTITHMASWLAEAPSNNAATNSFALNNRNYLNPTQILNFYNKSSNYQSSGKKYLSNGQNFLDLPQTDITGVIGGLIASLGSELANVEASVRAMIPQLDENPIGWVVGGTLLLDAAFATLLTTIEQMVTPLSWNSLNPLKLGTYLTQSGNILFNPLSTHEKKLQAIGWIQASKLTNNVLTVIGAQDEYANDLYIQLALATAQTVNSFLGFAFTLQLNTLDGYSRTNFLSAPLGVQLNIWEFVLDLVATGIDLSAAIGNVLNKAISESYTNDQISAGVNLGTLTLTDAILFLGYIQKLSSLIEGTIFWSKFVGDTFKAVVYWFAFGDSPPNELEVIAEGIAGALMLIANIAQYFSMISEPS